MCVAGESEGGEEQGEDGGEHEQADALAETGESAAETRGEGASGEGAPHDRNRPRQTEEARSE